MNKATAEIKETAHSWVEAIKLLVAIMNSPKKPDAIRIQAADKLLDRGYGRPAQPVGGEPDEPITVIIRRFGVFDPVEDEGVCLSGNLTARPFG